MRRRSRISSIREQGLEDARLLLASGLVLELAACEEAEAQRLPGCHLGLFGLELLGDVDECPRRCGDWHAIAPDGADLLVVWTSVDDDTRWATQPSVPPWDEQVDLAGDVVAQLKQ